MDETSRSTQNGATWAVFSIKEKPVTPAKAAWMKGTSAQSADGLKNIWVNYLDGVIRSTSEQQHLTQACAGKFSEQLNALYGSARWGHVTDLIFDDITANVNAIVLKRWIQDNNIVYETVKESPEQQKRLLQVYQTQEVKTMNILLDEDYNVMAQAYANAATRLEIRVAQEAGTLAKASGCR